MALKLITVIFLFGILFASIVQDEGKSVQRRDTSETDTAKNAGEIVEQFVEQVQARFKNITESLQETELYKSVSNAVKDFANNVQQKIDSTNSSIASSSK